MSAVLEAPAPAADQSALLASVDDVLRNMPVGQLLGQAEWLRQNGQLPAIIPLYRRWIGVIVPRVFDAINESPCRVHFVAPGEKSGVSGHRIQK